MNITVQTYTLKHPPAMHIYYLQQLIYYLQGNRLLSVINNF